MEIRPNFRLLLYCASIAAALSFPACRKHSERTELPPPPIQESATDSIVDPGDEAGPDSVAEVDAQAEAEASRRDAEDEGAAIAAAQAELDKELTGQQFEYGIADDTAGLLKATGTRNALAFVGAALGPQLKVGQANRDARFYVGDFNGDGEADVAMYVCVSKSGESPPHPGLHVSHPMDAYFREHDPNQSSTPPPPDTGNAAFYDEAGRPFSGTVFVHGPFRPGVVPSPGAVHLAHSGEPSELHHWLPGKGKPDARWLKGESLYFAGEGSGNGYLYYSDGRYRYQLTEVGDLSGFEVKKPSLRVLASQGMALA